jgi:CBS-domain-containing membrane protein
LATAVVTAFGFAFLHEPVLAVLTLVLGAAIAYARSLLKRIRSKH